jgi:hypothetical protein
VVESLSGTSAFGGGTVVGSTHSPSAAPGAMRQTCFLAPGGVLLRNLIRTFEKALRTKQPTSKLPQTISLRILNPGGFPSTLGSGAESGSIDMPTDFASMSPARDLARWGECWGSGRETH